MNMRSTSTGELENGPFEHWRPDFRFMSGFEMLSAKGGWVGQDLSGKILLKKYENRLSKPPYSFMLHMVEHTHYYTLNLVYLHVYVCLWTV